MEVPSTPTEALRRLTGDPVSLGYRPNLPLLGWWAGDGTRPNYQQLLLDVEAMLFHPRVKIALDYYKSGVANAKFKVRASTEEVGEFALRMLRRFWQRSREQADRRYEYGRAGFEVCYEEQEGHLTFAQLIDFFPLDCHVLTAAGKYAGVRIRSGGNAGLAGTASRRGRLDLWGPGFGWPSKGLWLTHNKRYHRWYGLTQLYGAWRPWRRLAGRDGAEEIIDGGVYRFAYAGPVMHYPAEDYKNQQDGNYQGARDRAREFVENAKAGVSVAFPLGIDDKGQPVRKWLLDWPQHVLNVSGLLEYDAYLQKLISLGIGVPPELLEASETGSGYSGRAIPMEAFLTRQQVNAEDLTQEIAHQIILPLVWWNFGREHWFEFEVQSLLETRQQGKLSGPSGAPGGAEQPQNPMDPLTQLLNGGGAGGGGGEEGGGAGAEMSLALTPDWDEFTRADGTRGWKKRGSGEVQIWEGDRGAVSFFRRRVLKRPALLSLPTPKDEPQPAQQQWTEYEGKRGRRKGQHGWRNQRTGRVVWDEGGMRAGGGGPGPEVVPAQVEHLSERIKLLRGGNSPITPEAIRRVTEQLLSLPVKELKLLYQLLPLGLSPDDARRIKLVLDTANQP
jgi:hypothetical protein